MVRVNAKKILTALLAGLLVVLLIPAVPVMAGDETSTGAEVDVLPAELSALGQQWSNLKVPCLLRRVWLRLMPMVPLSSCTVG